MRLLSEVTAIIFEELREKMLGGITKIFLSKNVYKITLAVCRHETMKEEMRLKQQMKRLTIARVSPEDLDINKFFLLNESGPIY